MPTETIDQFHTRLRGLAKYCDFHDTDFEIKMQIACNGTSTRLRKRALRDAEYSLKDMLVEGRKTEISTAQASGIEEKFRELRVNAIRKPGKKCYYYGFDYPHTDRPCPAQNTTCTVCGKKGHFAKLCRSTRKQEPQIQVKKRHPFLQERRITSQKLLEPKVKHGLFEWNKKFVTLTQTVPIVTDTDLLMTKEQLKHYCFEQKRRGTDDVALATIFST